MTLPLRYWIVAGLAAIILHLLALAAIVDLWSGGATQLEPTQSVEVSLNNLGGAPAAASQSAAQEAKAVPATPEAAAISPEAASPDTTKPAVSAPSAEASSPDIETLQAASVVATAQAEPAPRPSFSPSPEPPTEAVTAEPAAPPSSRKSTGTSEDATAAKPVERRPEHHQAGSQSAIGGTPAQTSRQYIADLRSALERAQRYPEDARRSNVEGTVVLHLIYDRSGALVRAEIQRSSGSPQLDQAALAAAKRARPIGRMPSTMQRTRLDIVIPVRFSLNKR